MKKSLFLYLALLTLAGCSGGGGGSSSSDQNDPTNDDDPTTSKGKVECLKQRLSNLPDNQKKVIELSANAVIACKASKNDVMTFIKSRDKK